MNKLNHLPQDWKIVKLGDVCEIIMGQSPPSKTYNSNKIGLPFFQGKAEFSDLYPIPMKWCSVPNKIAEPNDILLSVRAPVGATNIVNQKCCIGRGLAAIRFKNYKYIYYFFKTIANELNKKGTGTTFKAISGEIIKSTLLPLPSKETQQKIVSKIEDLFDSIDSGIEYLKKAQEKLKLYRQSVLKAAFAGELTMDNGEWKVVKLGEVCEKIQNIVNSKQNPESEFFYYDIGGIDNTIQKVMSKKIYLWKDAPSRAKQIIKKNDILFSMIRTYLKNIAILEDDFENQIGSTGFCVIRTKKEILNYKYCFYFIISDKFLNPLNELQRGSSYPAVGNKDVFIQDIPLPALEIQQKIVKEIEGRLSAADEMTKQVNTSLEKAELLKHSILKQAFEGKLISN